jgi:hypothetical protein
MEQKTETIYFCDNNKVDLVSKMPDLDQYLKLVQFPQTSRILHCLGKIERLEYIHVFVDMESQIRILLPRYNLNFQICDDKVRSLDYNGWNLAAGQQLKEMPHCFTKYLVFSQDASNTEFGYPFFVLVPQSKMSWVTDKLELPVSELPSVSVSTSIWKYHDGLQSLVADDRLGRILLAIFCAMYGYVPIALLGQTGFEASLDLIRQCWINRPLREMELYYLCYLKSISRPCPSLVVTISDLLKWSDFTKFLHSMDAKDQEMVNSELSVESKALEAYAISVRKSAVGFMNLRLTAEEETRVFGETLQEKQCAVEWTKIELPVHSLNFRVVEETEEEIQAALTSTIEREDKEFPLGYTGENPIEQQIYRELEESWRNHIVSDKKFSHSIGIEETFVVWKKKVKQTLVITSDYLQSVHALCCSSSPWFKLLELKGSLGAFLVKDMIRCVLDPDYFEKRFLALNSSQRNELLVVFHLYFKLHILHMKLERTIFMFQSKSPRVFAEMRNVRQYSTMEHPYWMIYEFEGLLQIRPEQFQIARHLIDRPGVVSQLNMGLGKTRVVLPMIALYFLYRKPQSLVRLSFPESLLSEASNFLQQYLGASQMKIPIFTLPFHREITLDEEKVEKMIGAVALCQRMRGVFLISPSQRLSLVLKIHENRDQGDLDALLEIVESNHWIDILDESDSILSIKYQLVYANGAPEMLQNGAVRWELMESVLMIMSRNKDVAVLLGTEHTASGQYPQIRLTEMQLEDPEILQKLYSIIINSLLDNPPGILDWIASTRWKNARMKKKLMQLIIDNSKNAKSIMTFRLGKERFLQLLMLRGIFAHGLLKHVLSKRYCVNYGLDERRTKQMAVPYLGADVPTDRSEFSHPDIAIFFTLLAFYHRGLTRKEFSRAMQLFMLLGASSRQVHLRKWLQDINSLNPEPEHLGLFDDHRKLDLSNQIQQDVMYRYLKKNMDLIHVYVNQDVFPAGTKQFPQNLSASPWTMVESRIVNGFSGTNDTKLLLPLKVRQVEPEIENVLGTNGKTIDMLIANSTLLELPNSTWKILLKKVIESKVSALIDTGSLLGGVSNRAVANFLIQHESFDYKYVMYFEKKEDDWMILNKETNVATLRRNEPVTDRESFILFDDARTRGVDKKMAENAVSMLTLGARIAKDKLVQGAGRMRALGSHQKLIICYPEEIKLSIEKYTGREVSIHGILSWVVRNTREEIEVGLPHWIRQGYNHAISYSNPENRSQDVHFDIETLYAREDVPQNWTAICNEWMRKSSDRKNIDEKQKDLLKKIFSSAIDLGRQVVVQCSVGSEEVERELARIAEEEISEEKQLPCPSPYSDESWEYGKILLVKSMKEMMELTTIIHISEFQIPVLHQLVLSSSNLFVTHNFCKTINNQRQELTFSRMIKGMLVFSSGEVLLLSERESNEVYFVISQTNESLPFAYVDYGFVLPDAAPPLMIGAKLSGIGNAEMAAMRIWNGETNFHQSLHSPVSAILSHSDHTETLYAILTCRGLFQSWESSDLETLSRAVARELESNDQDALEQ